MARIARRRRASGIRCLASAGGMAPHGRLDRRHGRDLGDTSAVGVPSDYYYLAATGPLLSRLTRSDACRSDSQQVFLDNAPSFDAGAPGSAGDYMARGEGTCHVDGRPTRWAYFVAAPGFGPVRAVGIPQSGLYVVVAVMRDTRRAPTLLDRLIDHTSFGGARVSDFVTAARGKLRAA
jgi:hypothetical protein